MVASVFTAEFSAIILALLIIYTFPVNYFTIFSDSRNALSALNSYTLSACPSTVYDVLVFLKEAGNLFCRIAMMTSRIVGSTSIHETGIGRPEIIAACLASLSACSFSGTSTRPGTQQNSIRYPLFFYVEGRRPRATTTKK